MKKNTINSYIITIGFFLSVSILHSCLEAEKPIKYTSSDFSFQKIKPQTKIFNLNGLDKRGYKYGEFTVTTLDNHEHPFEWSIYKSTNRNSVISLPNTWILEKEEGTFILAKLDSLKSDFFIWKTYDKEALEIDLTNFVKYFHNIIAKDTVEIASKVQVEKHTIAENKIGYYFNCEMNTKNRNAKVFSFITEDKKRIHEFTMKIFTDGNNNLNKILFDLIMEGVLIEEEHLLDKESDSFMIESVEFGFK